MAKHKSSPYMSPGEQIAGTVFFVIYLAVLPFAASRFPRPCKTPFTTTSSLP